MGIQEKKASMPIERSNRFTAAMVQLFAVLLLGAFATLPAAQLAHARFLSPDTWNPWLQGVDINRYAYAGNDPVNGSDPNGHQSIIDQLNYDDDNDGVPDDLDRTYDPPASINPMVDRQKDLTGIGGISRQTAKSIAKAPATTKVPNPGGKLGDARTKQRVADVVAGIEARGNRAVLEERFSIKNGYKSARFVDVAEYTRGGKLVAIHQVGVTTKKGIPVSRERKAFEDLQKSDQAKKADMNFHDKFGSPNSGNRIGSGPKRSCNWNGC